MNKVCGLDVHKDTDNNCYYKPDRFLKPVRFSE
jgi:hypothetical protein